MRPTVIFCNGENNVDQGDMDEKSSKHYKEINSLDGRLRELQLKFDSQTVLLKQSEEEVERLKAELRKFRAAENGQQHQDSTNNEARWVEELRQQLEEKVQENDQLNTMLEKSNYDNGELKKEVSVLKTTLEETKTENQQNLTRVEALQESLDAVKEVAFQYEEETQRLQGQLKEMEIAQSELQLQITAKDDMLGSLASEAKLIGKQKSDMNAARRETNRNRKQLLLLSDSSNRTQKKLHTSLLSYKSLLHELKTMYEENAEIQRAEMNSDREGMMRDYQKLKHQFEQLKLIQYEDKRQLLNEQREIVKALQTQFEEYRKTAEFLFETECSKLSEKLRLSTEKYEEEIRYIIRAKDQHFDQMMTAKDAKIMNLIEGSDLQTILIVHEQELEQVRKSHIDDLEAMRLRTEAEQRDTLAELHKEIQTQELTAEKLKTSLGAMEKQLTDAHNIGQKRLEQLAERDEAHMQELAHLQTLLQESHSASERLNQEKQDLRHKIIRLTIQAKGDADETLPSLVKRLSMETSNLKSKLGGATRKLESTLNTLKTLQQKYAIRTKELDQMRLMAEAKDKELHDMVQTLSKVMYYRVRAKFGNKNESKKSGIVDNYRGAIATLQQVLDGGAERSWLSATVTNDNNNNNNNATEDRTVEEQKVVSNNQTTEEDLASENDGSTKRQNALKPRVKAKIPHKLKMLLGSGLEDDDQDSFHMNGHHEVDRAEVMELAKGINYLKRFQQVSAAYTHGEFRLPLNVAMKETSQSTNVYENLNSLTLAAEINGATNEWWNSKQIYTRLEDGKQRAALTIAGRQEQLLDEDEVDVSRTIKVYDPSPPTLHAEKSPKTLKRHQPQPKRKPKPPQRRPPRQPPKDLNLVGGKLVN